MEARGSDTDGGLDMLLFCLFWSSDDNTEVHATWVHTSDLLVPCVSVLYTWRHLLHITEFSEGASIRNFLRRYKS